MKVSEIEAGKMYTNGKKREIVRKVTRLSTNPFYLYFETIKGFPGNDKYAVLRESFAKWAKAEVKEARNESIP
jgi:hypothetical protein